MFFKSLQDWMNALGSIHDPLFWILLISLISESNFGGLICESHQ